MKRLWTWFCALGIFLHSAHAIVDENGNGISDVWELVYYGTSWVPAETADDYDGDSQDALRESLFGTNPFDPTSLQLVAPPSLDTTNATFSFQSVAGILYQPQTSVALDAVPAWANFGGPILGTGGMLSVVVPLPGGDKLFFRVDSVLPRSDVDGDGLDSYEEALLGSSDATANSDTDALTDMEEFRLRQLGIDVDPSKEFTHPGVRDGTGDFDGDGVIDIDELRGGSNAADPNSYPASATVDTDNDGLPDAWEITNFGSIAAQDAFGNPDGDRLNNQQELYLGLNPNQAMTTSPYPDGLADQDADNVPDIWEFEDGTDPKNASSFDIQTNFVTLRGRLEHLSTFGPGGTLVQYNGTVMRATAIEVEGAQLVSSSNAAGIVNEVSGFTNPAGSTFVAEKTFLRFRKNTRYRIEIIAGRTDLPFVSGKFYWINSAPNQDEPNNKLVVYEVASRQWYITDSAGVPVAADSSIAPNPDVNNTHFTQKGSAASGGPDAVLYPTGTLTLSPLNITEVISDQIAGNNANKLPTAFFKTTNNPMLMAVRADGLAYMRCNVTSIVPQAVLSATKLRVGVRHVNPTTRVPDAVTITTFAPALQPTTNAFNFTTTSAQSDSVDLYQVVYGQDFDADTQLQQTETAGLFAKTPLVDDKAKVYTDNKELRDMFRVVTAAHIAYSTTQTKADRVIYNPFTDYAKHLLDSFVSGNTAGVTGATFTTGLTINAHLKLGHPVGGLWNASDNDLTHKFTFGSTSTPANDYNSSGYLEERIKQVVEANIAAIKAAAPAAYDTPAYISFPADATLTFPIETLTLIAKKRLGAAFGKCELVNATVLLRVTRKDRILPGPDYVLVEWDSFTGTITDTYDFAYVKDPRPRRASIIQAGYASFSVPAGNVIGKVCYTEVQLSYDPNPTKVGEYDLP